MQLNIRKYKNLKQIQIQYRAKLPHREDKNLCKGGMFVLGGGFILIYRMTLFGVKREVG